MMPKPDPKRCGTPDCPRPPRAAVRTTRPSRADVRVTLYTDDRAAPATASRYCHQCVRALVGSLVDTLVDLDDERRRVTR